MEHTENSITITRPARTCGDCSLCCKLLSVPEIHKPVGVWCDLIQINATTKRPTGCSVYETRPKACRDFSCLWLASDAAGFPMSDDLRPDRCKVVFGGAIDGSSSIAYVDPNNPDAWKSGRVRKVINRLITRFRVTIVCGDRQRIMLEPDARL